MPQTAARLLAHVLNWPLSRLRSHPNQPLTLDQQAHYQTLLERYTQGEPLAYLLGCWEFWSLDLLIGPAVLIPRPETERLVEIALAQIPLTAAWHIADLGTGSGAIALAVAKERPFCQIIATDSSSEALDVAKVNAKRLNLTNVTFRLGEGCDPLQEEQFHLILSNPPYIALGDPHLPALRYEPESALIAGIDGLELIRKWVPSAQAHLYKQGLLCLEHGNTQGTAVRHIFTACGYQSVETFLDLEGRERVTQGEWPGQFEQPQVLE